MSMQFALLEIARMLLLSRIGPVQSISGLTKLSPSNDGFLTLSEDENLRINPFMTEADII